MVKVELYEEMYPRNYLGKAFLQGMPARGDLIRIPEDKDKDKNQVYWEVTEVCHVADSETARPVEVRVKEY